MFWKFLRAVLTFLVIGIAAGMLIVSQDQSPPKQGSAYPSLQNRPAQATQPGKNFNF